MLFKVILAVSAITSLASAAPKKQEPRILQHDDVILPRADGGYDVMKDWEWSHIELRMEREAREREMENKRRALSGEILPVGANTAPGLVERAGACEQSSEIQILTDGSFTDWDVAMSPVISAGGGQALVAVSKGYSVANSLTVSTSTEFTLIENMLKTSIEISYGVTWTSTDTQTFTFYMTPGDYGLVVSNPLTRRVTGNAYTGCTDSPTVSTFTADSRTAQTFGGDLSWVTGPIRLCNSTTYPVPYCIGNGAHS